MAGIYDQAGFEVRCEWGLRGVEHLAPGSDAVIVVDVLSFSTAVDVAVSRGAVVYPYHIRDESATAFAVAQGALLAGSRGGEGYSLSPTSLLSLPGGTRLVLPSPNGATLSLAVGNVPTFAACLRNAAAVARAAGLFGARIAVIPAGERWSDGSLRPSLEDWLGAGAVIAHLSGLRSPEAQAAADAFTAAAGELQRWLEACVSGRELIARGYADDVRLAAQLNVSPCAPLLRDGAYVDGAASG